MKRLIVLALLLMFVPSVALAADPDFWGVDSVWQTVTTLDTWTDYGGGLIGNGDQMFGDWYMQVLWFFGSAVARRFG